MMNIELTNTRIHSISACVVYANNDCVNSVMLILSKEKDYAKKNNGIQYHFKKEKYNG